MWQTLLPDPPPDPTLRGGSPELPALLRWLLAMRNSEARLLALRVLGSGRVPLTSIEIAERIGFTRESVRWALNGLLALGQVEREVISNDGPRWCYGWRLRE